MNIEFTARNEGFSETLYRCTAKKLTIGYGFNVQAGVTKRVARAILHEQLREIHDYLYRAYDWYEEISVCEPVRAIAIRDMNFQLGFAGFRKFRKAIAAMKARDYETAAKEALDSRWAKQTPNRARRVARMIRTGKMR